MTSMVVANWFCFLANHELSQITQMLRIVQGIERRTNRLVNQSPIYLKLLILWRFISLENRKRDECYYHKDIVQASTSFLGQNTNETNILDMYHTIGHSLLKVF
jgi:hypothetical protein